MLTVPTPKPLAPRNVLAQSPPRAVAALWESQTPSHRGGMASRGRGVCECSAVDVLSLAYLGLLPRRLRSVADSGRLKLFVG